MEVDTFIQHSIESLDVHSNTVRNQTLVRILLPSILYALLTFTLYPALVHTLTEVIRTSFDGLQEPYLYGPATLNLILTDNSNQFIQNIHNFCGLLFTLITAHTFSFLIKQQERVYYALFEECSTIQSVLEQVALVSEGRPYFHQNLLSCIYKYLQQDIIPTMTLMTETTTTRRRKKEYEGLPAYMISIRPMDDPLETMLYLTSVGEPSHMYSTLRSLRQVRAKRLGSLQQKMPDIQMTWLSVLGIMVLCTFPVIATGAQTVGGEPLIQIQRIHLSIGAFALGCVLGIVHELGRPGIGSAYNIDYTVLQSLLRGLHLELQTRLHKCHLDLELENSKEINQSISILSKKDETYESQWKITSTIVGDSLLAESSNDDQSKGKYKWLAKSFWNRIRFFRKKDVK